MFSFLHNIVTRGSRRDPLRSLASNSNNTNLPKSRNFAECFTTSVPGKTTCITATDKFFIIGRGQKAQRARSIIEAHMPNASVVTTHASASILIVVGGVGDDKKKQQWQQRASGKWMVTLTWLEEYAQCGVMPLIPLPADVDLIVNLPEENLHNLSNTSSRCMTPEGDATVSGTPLLQVTSQRREKSGSKKRVVKRERHVEFSVEGSTNTAPQQILLKNSQSNAAEDEPETQRRRLEVALLPAVLHPLLPAVLHPLLPAVLHPPPSTDTSSELSKLQQARLLRRHLHPLKSAPAVDDVSWAVGTAVEVASGTSNSSSRLQQARVAAKEKQRLSMILPPAPVVAVTDQQPSLPVDVQHHPRSSRVLAWDESSAVVAPRTSVKLEFSPPRRQSSLLTRPSAQLQQPTKLPETEFEFDKVSVAVIGPKKKERQVVVATKRKATMKMKTVVRPAAISKGSNNPPAPIDDEDTQLMKRIRAAPYYKPSLESYCRQVLEQMYHATAAVIDTHSMEHVVGLSDIKDVLMESVILPTKCPQLFTGLRRPATSILLYGVSGCGLSLLSKAVAKECSPVATLLVPGSAIAREWSFGDAGEKLMRALFCVAGALAPCLILLDDVDKVLLGGGSSFSDNAAATSRRLTGEFLLQMDACASAMEHYQHLQQQSITTPKKYVPTTVTAPPRVVVLATTSRPFDLGEEVGKRFTKRIFVPCPDAKSRRQILHRLLCKPETINHFNDVDWQNLSESTMNFTCRDLNRLCEDVALIPLKEYLHKEEHTRHDATTTTTATRELLRDITVHDVHKCIIKREVPSQQERVRKMDTWSKSF